MQFLGRLCELPMQLAVHPGPVPPWREAGYCAVPGPQGAHLRQTLYMPGKTAPLAQGLCLWRNSEALGCNIFLGRGRVYFFIRVALRA